MHRRAAAWHRQHGTAAEAIDHAIAAGDLPEARELIAARWQEVLDEGLAATVASWLDRLPPEMIASDAQMCLIRALLASLHGRPEDMKPWLAAAEAAAPHSAGFHGSASAESATCFFRALHHCLDGDLAAAEPASRQAAELELESGSAYWRARTIALFGAILFWRGHDADAQVLLERAIRPAHQPTDNLARQLALSLMAAICCWQGDREAAGRYAREAADLGTRNRLTVAAEVVSADLLAGRGELAAAETAALAALDVARHHRWRLDTAAALVSLARIYTRAGRAAEAQNRLGEASDLIATLPDPGILASLLADAKGAAGQPALAFRASYPDPPARRSDRPRGPGPGPADPGLHQPRDRRRARGQRAHRRTAPAERLPQGQRAQPRRRRRIHGSGRHVTPRRGSSAQTRDLRTPARMRRRARVRTAALACAAVLCLVLLVLPSVFWIAESGLGAGEGSSAGTPAPGTPPPAVDRFLAAYVRTDGRVWRPDQGRDTVSEGQAYGLLLAEAAGRDDLFGRIWHWTQAHMQRPDGLVAWHADPAGHILDPEPASDADLLTAWALLRYRGPGADRLHRDGRQVADAILAHEVATGPAGTLVLTAGPWQPAIPTRWTPATGRCPR